MPITPIYPKISLAASNLEFSFGRRVLFQNLHFEVGSGRILSISGQNGSGKSTLISILAGLRTPKHGKILLRDQNNVEMDVDHRSYIEYLPAEGNALFYSLSAEENLQYWIGLRSPNFPQLKIQEALERWGLAPAHPNFRISVGKFSTGMRRRLALARLELSNVPIWLLDEPLYGLDQKGAAQFIALIRKFLNDGGLVVLVNHEMGLFETFASAFVKVEL